MKDNFIIVTAKEWYQDLIKELKQEIALTHISTKEDLNIEKIKKLNPRFIFFPHWSYYIPKEIYENYECVVFHMTDLPYGRGGSPLQNLIIRGHKKTKMSALKVIDVVDGGPIYMKRDLSLEGTALEIFQRAVPIIGEMIKTIIFSPSEPEVQSGSVVEFKRRTEEESSIAFSKVDSIEELYNFIRMLDCPGYPPANFELKNFKFEFKEAKLNGNELNCYVRISQK